MDLTEIGIALILVVLNGFFVAAEFALVKVRSGQLKEMIQEGRPFARLAKRLHANMESSLSTCQLGITMASLALGWVGEPAFAHLLEPVVRAAGITSETVLHAISFVVAFTTITALHLVIGEQAPKIFAIRRPEQMILWCAAPLQFFLIMAYPLMTALNWTTSKVLSTVGMHDGEHDAPHTDSEIRHIVGQAHVHGSLSRTEHSLINAIFEFDDTITRRIMVPRNDVDFFDIDDSLEEVLALVKRSKHTRYPVCDGSLDELLGVAHVKDLVGAGADFNLQSIMRPPKKVPETLPISNLLRHFQATHQLMAFVVDEYGVVIGVVTLENVLEQIIGSVNDEFDIAEQHIAANGPDTWIVLGSTPIEVFEEYFKIESLDSEVDTFGGMLMHFAERILTTGDSLQIEGWNVRVLETRDNRIIRASVEKLPGSDTEEPEATSDASSSEDE